MKDISEKYDNNRLLDGTGNGDELSDLETHVLANKIERNIKEHNHNSEIVSNLRALGKYISDKDVKWYRKSLVIAALAYFIKPDKVLPNWKEFFNFLDDVGAIDWTVRFLGKELDRYY